MLLCLNYQKAFCFPYFKKYQKSVESEISQNVSDSVSDLDQEILMSIVGYVLHSLKKSSEKKCKAANHVKMSSIIESLSMKNSLSCKYFVSRHKECMEKINRGGLNYCKSTNFGVLLYLANLANCVFSLIFVAANIYADRTL